MNGTVREEKHVGLLGALIFEGQAPRRNEKRGEETIFFSKRHDRDGHFVLQRRSIKKRAPLP